MGFNQLFLALFLQMVILILASSPVLPSSTPILESSSFPIAKPGCDDHCGDVSIPFPFGTKEGCYLNEEFFINCTESSNNAPQPLLQSAINVTNISLKDQHLRLSQFIGFDCYNQDGSRYGYDQDGSPYGSYPWMTLSKRLTFNSTTNKLITVGCDTISLVEGFTGVGRYYATGCVSYCLRKEDINDVDDNSSCAGSGCCQTSIPPGAWQINVSLASFKNHTHVWKFNPCSYAFVVEDGAFRFFADNLTLYKLPSLRSKTQKFLSLPVVVDWTIDNMTCEAARKNTTTYACSLTHSRCDELRGLGYRCLCEDGYDGNPYLPDGCQDIDECKENRDKCSKNSACKNTMGNYTCPCLKGYHGNDGREGGDGCIPDNEITHWPMTVSGVGIGTAILLLCCFCLYSELKTRKENRLKMEFFKKNGGLILQQQLQKQGGDMNAARIFTLKELKKATNDFDESQIIGRGGYGTVFKGVLADASTVAIKKSKGICENQVEQFVNEVIVLSRINNNNRYVVKLLGCCLETEVPLLVYEFISNGTLSDHIHNQTKAAKLSWDVRIRIASEVARVLAYLHSTASPPIVHRDIKSSNILLDQNYTAKVSDFGISKLVSSNEDQVSTAVQGTPGYLDPEYLQTGLLTEKSDVYSYGVVLIELLTGKKAVSWERPEAQRYLAHHFISSLKEGLLIQVLDPNILCNESTELLDKVAMIAKFCLSVRGEDRPSMNDIARELEVLEIRAKQSAVQVFDIDSTNTEALLCLESTNTYVNADDSSWVFTGSRTITQSMMLPTDSGR